MFFHADFGEFNVRRKVQMTTTGLNIFYCPQRFDNKRMEEAVGEQNMIALAKDLREGYERGFGSRLSNSFRRTLL